MQKTFFHILTLWALQLPLTWTLGHYLGWGENGVWWGIFFAKLVGAAIMLLWFMQGTWQSKVIEPPEKTAEPVVSDSEADIMG